MRRAITSASAVVMLALLTACSGMAEQPGFGLDGTAWQLTGWAEAGSTPAGFTITASFADGRVAGKAAVNNYFAAYTEGPGNRFTVGRAGSTMMAGPPPAMQAEQTYLKLLERVQTYSRAETALTLADAEGKPLLEFSPAAP